MKKIIGLVALIFLLSMISGYALDCGFQNPAASSTNISLVLNASYSNAGISEQNISIAYYLQSGGNTRNNTLSLIVNQTNTSTSSGTQINNTFYDTYVYDDGSDYTLSCTCTNSTAVVNCNATRTSMQVNRNVPTAPTAITFTNPLLAGNTLTATINRANSNRCWVQFGSSSVERRAMSVSGSTCTFTVQADSPPNSDYPTFFSADDRIDASAVSAVQSVTIRARASDGGGILGGSAIVNSGGGPGQSALGGFGSSNPFAPKDNTIIWIVGIILVLVYINNKKK